jgi:hypothetical protein
MSIKQPRTKPNARTLLRIWKNHTAECIVNLNPNKEPGNIQPYPKEIYGSILQTTTQMRRGMWIQGQRLSILLKNRRGKHHSHCEISSNPPPPQYGTSCRNRRRIRRSIENRCLTSEARRVKPHNTQDKSENIITTLRGNNRRQGQSALRAQTTHK